MRRPAIAAIAVSALLAVAGTAHAARWWRPVPGPVVGVFDYDPSRPFRPGARRGVRLAVRPGDPVRAACTGRVAFSGRLPRGEAVLSVRCGPWHVTHLGVDAPASALRVRAGEVVGTAIARTVGLGVRRASRRWGYVDPATLMPGPPPAAGPAPAPVGRGPRRRGLPSPSAPPAAGTVAVPLTAWAGLALVLVAGASACRAGRARVAPPSRARPAAAVVRPP